MIAPNTALTPQAARSRLHEVRREIERLHERDAELGSAMLSPAPTAAPRPRPWLPGIFRLRSEFASVPGTS